jgi:hypothetical protein
MKRYVVAGIIGVAGVWLGMIVIGGMRADAAGTALVRPQVAGTALAGFPVPSELTIMAVGVALLGAYLTAKS